MTAGSQTPRHDTPYAHPASGRLSDASTRDTGHWRSPPRPVTVDSIDATVASLHHDALLSVLHYPTQLIVNVTGAPTQRQQKDNQSKNPSLAHSAPFGSATENELPQPSGHPLNRESEWIQTLKRLLRIGSSQVLQRGFTP